MAMFKLDGKTALVTGASRGIGYGYAEALAEAGADIIGVALEPCDELGERVRALGRKFAGYTCDFSSREATTAWVAEVKKAHPVIDILVSNAGTIARAPVLDHSDEMWDKVVETNVSSHFVLAREFGREMVARGHGKIIFTASMLTFQGGINVCSYSASKGAIAQLAKALANEWASKGVQVNCIAPGYIATENTKALRADAARSESILARIPAGRWGLPADLKGPAIFLASSASDYVTGHVLAVDGGWLAR